MMQTYESKIGKADTKANHRNNRSREVVRWLVGMGDSLVWAVDI
jgi:hypothetical protein